MLFLDKQILYGFFGLFLKTVKSIIIYIPTREMKISKTTISHNGKLYE